MTHSICHTIKENPGCVSTTSALDKGYVVTGLDAQHRKKLHLLAWNRDFTSSSLHFLPELHVLWDHI